MNRMKLGFTYLQAMLVVLVIGGLFYVVASGVVQYGKEANHQKDLFLFYEKVSQEIDNVQTLSKEGWDSLTEKTLSMKPKITCTYVRSDTGFQTKQISMTCKMDVTASRAFEQTFLIERWF